MDAQSIVAIIGGALAVGGAIVGIALHAGKSRDVAESALHKARNVETVHSGYVIHVDQTYARKAEIAPELNAIKASLARIEKHQDMMAQRFMNGGLGT